ncbi:hypothetical protein [Trichloromonas sp.]|nr:hypothetical protein [Trichloromonas sp.]
MNFLHCVVGSLLLCLLVVPSARAAEVPAIAAAADLKFALADAPAHES